MTHEPLELAERLLHLVGVRPDAGGGHPAQDQALHLALQRLVEDAHPGRVPVRLRDVVERELVALRGLVPVPRLEQADHEVAVVRAEEVQGVRRRLLRRAALDVVVEVALARQRNPEVAGQGLPGERVVGVALDVRVAALGVHAAARAPDVAEQQLQHRAGADHLRAGRVVGEADRVDDRHHLVRPAHLADELRDLEELFARDAGDALDHLGRVARVVLAHQVQHRARMLDVEPGKAAVGPGVAAPRLGLALRLLVAHALASYVRFSGS